VDWPFFLASICFDSLAHARTASMSFQKRLPVWRVDFDTNFNERYYVETSSGKLSVRVDDTDLLEGYSFAMFHKHHFMDWGGKELRDFSTMFWAMAQVILVVIGIMYWRKTVSKK
jgi:hypothetical protein